MVEIIVLAAVSFLHFLRKKKTEGYSIHRKSLFYREWQAERDKDSEYLGQCQKNSTNSQ